MAKEPSKSFQKALLIKKNSLHMMDNGSMGNLMAMDFKSMKKTISIWVIL